MSYDETILLKIRREFSGNEKYRLFLKHLDNVELELKKERERATTLIKENSGLKAKLVEAEAVLDEYTTKGVGKTCVRMKTFNKLQRTKEMYEKRFWEVWNELQELKKLTNGV